MSDSTQRYIEIDRLIRDGKNNTVSALARHFSLSERQIKRDLKAMREVHHAPLKASGRKGYCYTDAHWFFPAIGLNEQDIFTLGLASRTLEHYKGTPLHEHLSAIFDRLTQYVDRNEVTLDPAWLSKDITLASEPCRRLDVTIWQTALQCLRKRRVIQFKYQSPGGSATTRTMEIWHCLHWHGDWYLVGKDLSADEVKLFALSRFKSIKEGKQVYSIPNEFNFKDYIDPEMGLYTNDSVTFRVIVRFDPGAAPYAAERIWHSSQKVKALPDGSLELEFQTNQLTQTTSWLLAWGKSVLVLQPPELVARLKDHAQAMVRHYTH